MASKQKPDGLLSLAKMMNGCAAVLIGLIVALINADVIARFFFDLPIRGAVEIVALAIPATIFLSLAFLQQNDKLIRADAFMLVIASRWPTVNGSLRLIFALIAATLTSFIVLAVWPEFIHSIKNGIYRGTEGDFVVPVWPLQFVVLTGAILLLVFECRHAFSIFKSGVSISILLFGIGLFCVPWLIADSRAAIGACSIVAMFVFVYLGLPVAYALLASGMLGIVVIKGSLVVGVKTLGLVATGAVGSYVFAAVPLFVLLGVIVGAANIGRDSLQSAHWMLARVVGGLAVSTVVANAIFAAITGISIASAAIFSRIAVPPLIEQGYQPRFAVGLVAGSSVLGMLIPPSLLLIIYGLIAEVSINALFTAAIIPGLLLSGFFIILIFIVAIFKPRFAVAENFTNSAINPIHGKAALEKALPIASLIVIVLGGIYGGIFTPTEAGAVGALAAFALSVGLGRLHWQMLPELLLETAQSSASILSLILGASAFSIMLALSGIPNSLGEFIAHAGMGLIAYTFVYLFILILLGTVLDSTSILLIMVPLALPTVISLNGNLIWFGIVSVIGVEIGLLTPPLGLSVYTIKSSLEDNSISLTDIFIGALPFVFAMAVIAALIIVLPNLTLGLLN